MEDLPSPGYQYPPQSNVNKIAIKQPQNRNRNRPILTLKKKPEERKCAVCKLKMEDEYHFVTVCSLTRKKETFYPITAN